MLEIKRNELKFYITYLDYIYLTNILKKFMKPDPHAINGPYFIRSLYFDSINDQAVHEKLDGIETRKKYRLRIYNTQDKTVKFEIKQKFNNQVLKQTGIIEYNDALKIIEGDYEPLLKYKNQILNKIYINFKTQKLKPVIIIDYYRDAYMHELNNIRITFDQNLQINNSNFNIFSDSIVTHKLLNQNNIILEIKFDKFLPVWIKKLIQLPKFEKCAISKYCIGRLNKIVP
ncbi:MAG: polyphosphate polymerase domain-containing protein [Nanoarchaeota archaeon]|nr:polyphosphate polymerase domain-containing protein [Nanoarchaeota archaeon]